ncbi:TM2 domain-containing protein, partial [Streptomyces sp. CWNU-52B]|uniref:TM2 domain-containing protein n=1 Tax=Streptomyces sp. CWNU-52B TaxID=3394353 RepID=UPI0039BF607D
SGPYRGRDSEVSTTRGQVPLFLGVFGAHHFYLGRVRLGLLHLFTLGLCGLGWLADAFALPRQVRSVNARTAPGDPAGRPAPNVAWRAPENPAHATRSSGPANP